MTDKEFKRLNRAELLDIIYQLQVKQEELVNENARLKEELADRRIRMRQAGNIAEASLALHNVMQAAQDAASQYLEEIRLMREEAEEISRLTIEKANRKAEAIVNQARRYYASYDTAVEAILDEYKHQ